MAEPTAEYTVTEGNFVVDDETGVQKGEGEIVKLTAEQFKVLKAAKVVEK